MSFYNVHYYAFPLLSILEMYMPKRCSPDGYADFDIIQLSEIDPTWTNDELAFFVNPEAAAVANPIAQAACTADAALGVVGKTLHLKEINTQLEAYAATRANNHWEAKIRQVVQDERYFERVAPGTYRLAA
jgi:hypothetical protein